MSSLTARWHRSIATEVPGITLATQKTEGRVPSNGKSWAAKIGYEGKCEYLGSFGTEQEAAAAFDRAARQT